MIIMKGGKREGAGRKRNGGKRPGAGRPKGSRNKSQMAKDAPLTLVTLANENIMDQKDEIDILEMNPVDIMRLMIPVNYGQILLAARMKYEYEMKIKQLRNNRSERKYQKLSEDLLDFIREKEMVSEFENYTKSKS